MARLKLLDLRCIKSEDFGGDEAYLTADGDKIWKTDNIEAGDTVSLRSVEPVDFARKIKLELFDKDSGFFDSDDNLGSAIIKEHLLNESEQECSFNEEGADYILIYEVLGD